MMWKKYYRIGGILLEVFSQEEVIWASSMAAFEDEPGAGEAIAHSYELIFTRELPVLQGRVILRRPDLCILATDTGEARIIGIQGMEDPYAVTLELDQSHTKVWIMDTAKALLDMEVIVLSLLSPERRMSEIGSLILHCAYVRRQGKALLFSAASGTGKTTQANLWEKYRGTETINGDKGLLQLREGSWMACGWPVSGSSGICRNEEMEVGAIVMLGQAAENHGRPLAPGEAFSQIYSQITCNRWDRKAMVGILDQLEKLTAQVPVYHLDCNISEDAVKCLEELLGDWSVEKR